MMEGSIKSLVYELIVGSKTKDSSRTVALVRLRWSHKINNKFRKLIKNYFNYLQMDSMEFANY